jgi:Domain of unknown function (DUF6542)
VPATHRSAHPNIPGVPWWGALVIAVTATTIGFAFDAGSGDKELTSAFAAMYFLGCVAAVLGVRQSGIFTAVVQPPLILFVAVPGAYYLFHQAEIDGIKDILINCGYPLIERFVLMFTTSLLVLLIGAARWYFGAAGRTGTAAPDATGTDAAAAGGAVVALAALRAKLSSLFGGETDDDEDPGAPGAARTRKHVTDRSATAQRRTSTRRTTDRAAKRPPPTRSRHARPPIDDLPAESPTPRRRRPASFDDEPDLPPRRRPRPPRESGLRDPSREYRSREPREPREPRDAYDRPRRRPNRYESYDEPYDAGSYDPVESFDAPPPRPRRPTAGGSTHHPVSRVRYRGSADEGDDRMEHRTPPRSQTQHDMDSDRWRYDV